ncbi:TetR/AcrR family transcriptional regulator [Dactylosporangium sp. CA-233914]|uniref:TetR/AcrR family transcriptional regulator n=1 Tax=Dactylosporangium sp. CA-233914 TaxID=3239934 RepID=UPI003D8CF182
MDDEGLRGRLIRAGVELVDAQGSGAVSLREIARWAGVSHGAPRRYFPTHVELLSAIAREGFAELAERLSTVPEGPARARLGGLARAYLAFAGQRRGMYELMFRHDLLRSDHLGLRDASLPLFETLVELLAAARRETVAAEMSENTAIHRRDMINQDITASGDAASEAGPNAAADTAGRPFPATRAHATAGPGATTLEESAARREPATHGGGTASGPVEASATHEHFPAGGGSAASDCGAAKAEGGTEVDGEASATRESAEAGRGFSARDGCVADVDGGRFSARDGCVADGGGGGFPAHDRGMADGGGGAVVAVECGAADGQVAARAAVAAGALWASLHGIAQLWHWGSLGLATGAESPDALLEAALDAHVGRGA